MSSSEVHFDEDDPAYTSPPEIGARPLLLLALAALGVVASAACLAGGPLSLNYAGYLLATVITFCPVALSRRLETRRTSLEGVAPSSRMSAVALALLVLGLGLAIAHAWIIARHYA